MTEQTTGKRDKRAAKQVFEHTVRQVMRAYKQGEIALEDGVNGLVTYWDVSAPSIGEGREPSEEALQAEQLDDCRAAFAQIKKLAPGPANWQDIEWICDRALAAIDFPSTTPREDGEDAH